MAGFLGFWFKTGLAFMFVGLVSVALVYAYRYVTVQPFFALNEVRVSGNSHQSDATLLARAGINLGQNIFEVNIGQIQERLQKDPWIDRVSIRRVLPDRLEIHVGERQACFWVIREHELFYADQRGRLIDKVEPAHFISLPILGPLEKNGMEDVLSRTVDLLNTNSLPFGFASIENLAVSPDGNLEIFLNRPDMLVTLGVRELETNCRRLTMVWNDLEKRREHQRVRSLQAFAGKVWADVS
ncbi:cell division protein FtsQ/DivIB [Desulfoplanes formicivorans]|uniref:cell division protein FtsQ/DivIB n=1 Tax=Desulfoplanes formicivorans TaxID=1592317 RepID=UPI00159EFF6D|nr:FtsQ-type POTRA domain-containing protein [Desulfoplanes formicivorans]